MTSVNEIRQMVRDEVKKELSERRSKGIEDQTEPEEEDFSLWAAAIAVPTTMFRWTKSTAATVKNTAIVTSTLALIPALAIHWLYLPLYFVEAHEVGWGPINMKGLALGAGMMHGILILVAVVTSIFMFVSRVEDKRWWWE